MLNGLWAGMILIGIIFGAWNGKMPELTNAALDSSKDAVSLCITMLGSDGNFGVGSWRLRRKRDSIKKRLRKKLRPVIRFPFFRSFRWKIKRMNKLRSILLQIFSDLDGRQLLQD